MLSKHVSISVKPHSLNTLVFNLETTMDSAEKSEVQRKEEQNEVHRGEERNEAQQGRLKNEVQREEEDSPRAKFFRNSTRISVCVFILCAACMCIMMSQVQKPLSSSQPPLSITASEVLLSIFSSALISLFVFGANTLCFRPSSLPQDEAHSTPEVTDSTLKPTLESPLKPTLESPLEPTKKLPQEPIQESTKKETGTPVVVNLRDLRESWAHISSNNIERYINALESKYQDILVPLMDNVLRESQVFDSNVDINAQLPSSNLMVQSIDNLLMTIHQEFQDDAENNEQQKKSHQEITPLNTVPAMESILYATDAIRCGYGGSVASPEVLRAERLLREAKDSGHLEE